MKTIIENETNLSKYIFEDSAELTIDTNRIVTPDFIVDDLNSRNATTYENVTPPDDWIGNKYTFNGSTWAANPDWVELSFDFAPEDGGE